MEKAFRLQDFATEHAAEIMNIELFPNTTSSNFKKGQSGLK